MFMFIWVSHSTYLTKPNFPWQSRDAGKMVEKPVTKCDSGTQTDTHFMESNIVKSYEWNEWELRRKAIKLVRGDIISKQMQDHLILTIIYTESIIHWK